MRTQRSHGGGVAARRVVRALGECGQDRAVRDAPHELPAQRPLEWLDALAETWQQTDLVEEKLDVIHAVYERIVIAGPRFVGLSLTPAAYRHGWPSRCQMLMWRARPMAHVFR